MIGNLYLQEKKWSLEEVSTTTPAKTAPVKGDQFSNLDRLSFSTQLTNTL